MTTQRDFHDAAERIIADPAIDVTDHNALAAALDREAPGWREIPNEILQSEMAAIRSRWLKEADRLLDLYNALAPEPEPEPPRDAWGVRTHGLPGYARGCRCEVCTFADAHWQERRRERLGPKVDGRGRWIQKRFGDTPEQQAELDRIAFLYDREAMTLREIGEREGMTYENVRLRLKEAAVPVRDPGERRLDMLRRKVEADGPVTQVRAMEILQRRNLKGVPAEWLTDPHPAQGQPPQPWREGVPCPPAHRHGAKTNRRYEYEDYLNALRRVAGLTDDGRLSRKVYDDRRYSTEPSGPRVVQVFGTWNKAIIAAGLTPHAQPRDNYDGLTREDAIAALQIAAEEVAPRRLSAALYDDVAGEHGLPHVGIIRMLFRGSWVRAREAAGLVA